MNLPERVTPVNVDAPSTSASRETTPPATTQEVGKKKGNRKIVTFAQEFHNKRMEYMKLEHELKMQVLEEEKSCWTIMKQNSLQASVHVSGNMDSGETFEKKNFPPTKRSPSLSSCQNNNKYVYQSHFLFNYVVK